MHPSLATEAGRHLPPPSLDPVDVAAERVRRIPGVAVLWFHGGGPSFACARHCGEVRVATGATVAEALVRLEDDLRARNRDTVREAFRLL